MIRLFVDTAGAVADQDNAQRQDNQDQENRTESNAGYS